MKPTVAERIKKALDMKGIKQADLVKLTGIGKSSISTYISGEYEPKQKNIYKIAKALDVNEAWLMGYDVPSGRSITNSIPDETKNGYLVGIASGVINKNLSGGLKNDICSSKQVPVLGCVPGDSIMKDLKDLTVDVFSLAVIDNSMSGDGIVAGCEVSISLSAKVDSGDLVVVELLGKGTYLRRFHKLGDGNVSLFATDQVTPPLFCKESDITFIGAVTQSIRNYKN